MRFIKATIIAVLVLIPIQIFQDAFAASLPVPEDTSAFSKAERYEVAMCIRDSLRALESEVLSLFLQNLTDTTVRLDQSHKGRFVRMIDKFDEYDIVSYKLTNMDGVLGRMLQRQGVITPRNIKPKLDDMRETSPDFIPFIQAVDALKSAANDWIQMNKPGADSLAGNNGGEL